MLRCNFYGAEVEYNDWEYKMDIENNKLYILSKKDEKILEECFPRGGMDVQLGRRGFFSVNGIEDLIYEIEQRLTSEETDKYFSPSGGAPGEDNPDYIDPYSVGWKTKMFNLGRLKGIYIYPVYAVVHTDVVFSLYKPSDQWDSGQCGVIWNNDPLSEETLDHIINVLNNLGDLWYIECFDIEKINQDNSVVVTGGETRLDYICGSENALKELHNLV